MPLKEVRKGPRLRDPRGLELPSYFKNLSSSIKAYTIERFEETMPVVKRFKEVNAGYSAAEFRRDLRKNFKSIRKTVGEESNVLKTAFQNLKEDLKSGKIVNKERIKKNEAKGFDFGGGDNGNDEFNLGINESDFDLPSDNDFGDTEGSNVSSRQVINNFITRPNPSLEMESTKILGNTILQGASAQITSQSKLLNNMNYQNTMYYRNSLNIFNMMNTNIGSLIQGINSLGNLAEQTAVYQDNSLKIQQDILDIQRENLDILKSIYQKEDTDVNKVDESNIVEHDGTLNLKNYMKRLNRDRFNEALNEVFPGLGLFFQMQGMFSDLGMGGLANNKYVNSPLMAPLAFGFSKVIGPGIRKALKGLSNDLTNFGSAMLIRMNKNLGDRLFKGDGLFNTAMRGIFNGIGKFFGFSTKGKKDAFAQLAKEATPFDTYTRKAIIHVIPTLLSKILSAISGSPELVVDYGSGGRLVTKEAVKKEYETKKKDAIEMSFFEQMSDLTDKLKSAGLSKEQEGNVKESLDKLFMHMATTGTIYDPNDKDSVRRFKMREGLSDDMIESVNTLFNSMSDDLKLSLGKNVLSASSSLTNTIRELEKESPDSMFGQLFMDMNYTRPEVLTDEEKRERYFKSNKERDFFLKMAKKNPAEFIKEYGEQYGIKNIENMPPKAIIELWAKSVNAIDYNEKAKENEHDVFDSYASLDQSFTSPLLGRRGIGQPSSPSVNPSIAEATLSESDRIKLQRGIDAENNRWSSYKPESEKPVSERKYGTGIIGKTSKTIDEANEEAEKLIRTVTDKIHNSVMGLIYDDPKYRSDPKTKSIFAEIKDKLSEPARAFSDAVKNYWKGTKETIKEKFSIFKEAFKETVFGKDGKGGIVNLKPIKDYFSNMFKGVKQKAGSIFDAVKTGFKDLFKTGKTKKGLVDLTPLKNFGTELRKFLFGEEDRKAIFERLQKSFKEKGKAYQVAIGSGIGIVASMFLPGGPIVGGLLGAVSPLIFNFKKIKDTLFGEDSKFRMAMNKIKLAMTKENVLAGMASGGLVGGLVGLFTGTPTLGALAGSAVGGLISFISSTRSLKEKLFGSKGNDTGIFSRWLVTRAKRFLPTGAMALLGSSIGPFGIFGAVALGALAETTSFRRFLWGSKDKDGKKKQMGIFEMVTKYFKVNMTLPFKAFMSKIGDRLRRDLTKNIVAPFKHLGRTIGLVFKSQLDRLGGWFKGTKFYGYLERSMHFLTSKVTGIFGFIRGSLTKLFGPVTSFVTGGVKKALTGLAGILSLGISDKYKEEYEASKDTMKAEGKKAERDFKNKEDERRRKTDSISQEIGKTKEELEADRKRQKENFKRIKNGENPNDVLGEPDTPQLAEMRATNVIQSDTNEQVKKQTNVMEKIYDLVKGLVQTIKEKANDIKDNITNRGADQTTEAPPADGAGRGLFKGIIPDINSLGRGKISSLIGGAVKGIGGFFLNKGKNLLSSGLKAVKDFFLEGGWRRMAKKSLKSLLNVATLGMYKKVTNAWNRFKMEDERGISANEQTVTDPIAYVLEKMDIIIKHLGLLTNLDPMAECAEQTAKKVTEVANNTNDLEEQLLNVENAITTQTQVSAVGNAVEGVGSLLSAGGAVAKGGSLLGKAGPLLGKAGSLLGAGGSLIGKIGAGAKALSALGGAGSLLGAGGSALGSLGAILTGPIGIGLLAAAGGAYATYKGYKWYKKRKAEKAAEEQNKEAVEANINPAILNSGAITREQLEAAGLIKEQKKKKTVPNELGGNAYLEYLNTAGAPVATGRGPLSQLDPAIAGMDYSASGEKDSVGMAGCSPVSLYNAMSNMGSGLDPYSVINESKQYKVKGSGTSHNGLAQVAKLHGYNLNSSTSNFGSKIDQTLTSGGQSLVVGVGNEATSPFTPAGHTINIAGETGNDYIVSNPLHSGYEVWDKRAIDNNAMKVLSLSSSGRGEEPSTANKEGEPVSDKPENARTVDKAPLLEKIRSLFRIANNLRPDNIDGLHPLLLQKLVAYGEMFNEQKGRKPLITSAYRTRQDQTRIAGQSKKGMAAKPGTSKHEWGLAVDVNTADVDPSMIAGFGLSRPLLNLKAGKEPWHIEPMEWASKKTTQAKTIAEQMGGLTNASVTYNADMAKSIDTASSFQVDGKTGLINTASAIGSAASGMASGLAEIIKNALEQVFSIIGGTISKFKGTSDDSGKPYASSGSKSSASKPDSKAGIIKGSEATGDKKQFIESVTSGALKGYETGNVLPSLTVAQAALESGWGKKGIGNNLFGIKASKGWTGATRDVVTHEYDKSGRKYQTVAKFRDYPSIEEGIIDHTKFLQGPRYQKAGLLDSKEFYEATTRVKNAGYATDPKYPELLNKIISGRKIQVLDKAALEGNFSTTYAQALEKYGDSLGQGPSVMSIVPLLASKAVKDGINRIKTNQVLNKVKKDNLKANVKRTPTAFESISDVPRIDPNVENRAAYEASTKKALEEIKLGQQQQANQAPTMNNEEIVKALYLILDAIKEKEFKVDASELANNINDANNSGNTTGNRNTRNNTGRYNPNNRRQSFYNDNPADRGFSPFSPINNEYMQEVGLIAAGRGLLGF